MLDVKKTMLNKSTVNSSNPTKPIVISFPNSTNVTGALSDTARHNLHMLHLYIIHEALISNVCEKERGNANKKVKIPKHIELV